jgi:hypothetical protein
MLFGGGAGAHRLLGRIMASDTRSDRSRYHTPRHTTDADVYGGEQRPSDEAYPDGSRETFYRSQLREREKARSAQRGLDRNFAYALYRDNLQDELRYQ